LLYVYYSVLEVRKRVWAVYKKRDENNPCQRCMAVLKKKMDARVSEKIKTMGM
jgi:hypothetical protein